MTVQFRLIAQQYADLAVIRNIGTEPLQKLADALERATPRPLRATDLQRIFAENLPEKENESKVLMRVVLSLNGIMYDQQLSGVEIIEGLRFALETGAANWSPEEINRWRSVESPLSALLESPTIRLVSNTLDLMYEHANLLRGTRVVTDIRPVFNKDATSIEGAVISQTLHLRYDNAEGDHLLSLAMDENDIRELQRQCERALKKAQAARALMVQKAEISTIISGDNSDA